jgi:hypothetical protein
MIIVYQAREQSRVCLPVVYTQSPIVEQTTITTQQHDKQRVNG